MEFKGVITHIFPPVTGTSQATGNQWKSQSFRVEEYGQQYPASVVVSVFNDKAAIPQLGTFVTVHINAQTNVSRTDPSKFFNSLTVWKIDQQQATQQAAPAQPQAPVQQYQQPQQQPVYQQQQYPPQQPAYQQQPQYPPAFGQAPIDPPF